MPIKRSPNGTSLKIRYESAVNSNSNFGIRLFSVALGAIIYYVVLQIVLWLGLNSNDLKLLSAIVVAIFLAIPVMMEKWNTKRAYTEGGNR